MNLIVPSILSADFTKLGEELRAVERAGADWIHIDVMDGHFVPNLSMGPLIVQAVKRATALPLDVHLMIEQPDRYVAHFVEAGANSISVHVEASCHLDRIIRHIKGLGGKAGVALNPSSPLAPVEWVLPLVDYVLILGVNTGFGGQAFIPYTLEKIRRLRSMIHAQGLPTLIEVDGGVNEQTIAEIAGAGANIFVAGSSIFTSPDYARTINLFRTKSREHAQKGKINHDR